MTTTTPGFQAGEGFRGWFQAIFIPTLPLMQNIFSPDLFWSKKWSNLISRGLISAHGLRNWNPVPPRCWWGHPNVDKIHIVCPYLFRVEKIFCNPPMGTRLNKVYSDCPTGELVSYPAWCTSSAQISGQVDHQDRTIDITIICPAPYEILYLNGTVDQNGNIHGITEIDGEEGTFHMHRDRGGSGWWNLNNSFSTAE